MLQEVLSNHTPDVWTKASYDKTFLKFPVVSFTTEYDKVVEPFENLVLGVTRIQNPYIWGRFKLRKEQLARKGTIYECIMYHPIAEADVDLVAEYNCDYRRYTSPNSSQYSEKKPKLYKTPKLAKERYESASCSGTAPLIVVVRVLNTNMNVNSVEQKGWESEYVPEYAVLL